MTANQQSFTLTNMVTGFRYVFSDTLSTEAHTVWQTWWHSSMWMHSLTNTVTIQWSHGLENMVTPVWSVLTWQTWWQSFETCSSDKHDDTVLKCAQCDKHGDTLPKCARFDKQGDTLLNNTQFDKYDGTIPIYKGKQKMVRFFQWKFEFFQT